MNKLIKIAKIFQKKLTFASNVNLQHLNEVTTAVKSIIMLQPLWLTAIGGDPYSETDLENNINSLKQTIQQTNVTVNEHGLNQSGYAGFLNKINSAIDSLSTIPLKTQLDPTASNKLSIARTAITNAINNYIPIGIPAQNPKPKMEPVKMEPKQEDPTQPSGVAYNPEGLSTLNNPLEYDNENETTQQ